MMKHICAKTMVLITIILMDLLAGSEFDLFVPSFPELQHHFNLSVFWVEALLSVNFIGYAISLFFVGGLADHYGRKPMIILGLIIFIIGSLFCLSQTSYLLLLIGRFLQGIGIAAPAILSFLIIADLYPLQKQQFLMAMLNGVMNTSVAIAPVVGSYITLHFHWQGNFVALLGLGILVFIFTIFFVPHHKPPASTKPLLFRGYMPLFRSKPLLLLMIHIIFMFLPYWIFVGMAPLLYMKELGVSLVHFGYYQGALALVFAVGSIGFGFIMHRFNQKSILRVAAYLYLFSILALALVTFSNSAHPLFITLAFIPFVISQIIPSNILFPICINYMPDAKAKISAVLQGSRLIFSALSLQIASSVYQGSFKHIGVVILIFIILTLITYFFVLKNWKWYDTKPDLLIP